MPTYEYECESCGLHFDKLQKFSDPPVAYCPDCGGHVHRVLHPVGIVFKGQGFYVTDNRRNGSTGTSSRNGKSQIKEADTDTDKEKQKGEKEDGDKAKNTGKSGTESGST